MWCNFESSNFESSNKPKSMLIEYSYKATTQLLFTRGFDMRYRQAHAPHIF